MLLHRTRGRGRVEPTEEGELPAEDDQEEQKPVIDGAAYSADMISSSVVQPFKQEMDDGQCYAIPS